MWLRKRSLKTSSRYHQNQRSDRNKMNVLPRIKKSKKPRKIPKIKPSKFEMTEAIHSNKKYWTGIFNKLDMVTGEPTEENESRKLSEILPFELYQKVCHTLDMPVTEQTTENCLNKSADQKRRRVTKEPFLSYRKTLYIDREMESDTDVEISPREEPEELNIHQEFLQRPEREQVTWPTRYLQPEREDEKTLVRRADDLTDRIAQEFCDYMKQLGGNQQSQLFTPKAVKELFQVEFDAHVARSLRVVQRELPAVQEQIADYTGHPEKSHYAMLEREVSRDINAESKPDKATAFGRSLPKDSQWRAPRNDTQTLWRSARHVPKDLVTLKTVWEGITNLRSVKEYCRWMIEHPEHRRAPYLNSLGMFDPSTLGTVPNMEPRGAQPLPTVDPTYDPTHAPAPIEHIRRRLSQLADSN